MGVDNLVPPVEGDQSPPQRRTLTDQEFQDTKKEEMAAEHEEHLRRRKSEDRTD